jgi:hypothetical protein
VGVHTTYAAAMCGRAAHIFGLLCLQTMPFWEALDQKSRSVVNGA